MSAEALFHNPQKLRRIVGVLALSLPFSLLIIGLISPSVCNYRTISDYYFAPLAGDLLVGILFFMGFFLISYKGQPDYGASAKWDSFVSTVAGISAIGIAIFPVDGYSCEVSTVARVYVTVQELCSGEACGLKLPIRFFFFEYSQSLHVFSTVTFFSSLAYISFFLFTKHGAGPMSEAKKQRNKVYRITAMVIVAVMLGMGAKRFMSLDMQQSLDAIALTFWLETIGLLAFGFAWWVKGEGLSWLND